MNKNRKIIKTNLNFNNNKLNNNSSNSNSVNIALTDNNISSTVLPDTEKTYQSLLDEKFIKLESSENKTFLELNPHISEYPHITEYDFFLYHGIRFQNHLEKLEQIFESNAILAGNYQEYYYTYSDNCNEGEYISLLGFSDYRDLEYKTFVMPNISLVISPKCNAIKTIYLPYEEWEVISKRNPKNRYSYAHGEYQVKQMIPIDMVKAVGLPARYLRLTNQEYLIETYKNDILELMNKYNLELPIVDTSNYNRPIIMPENYQSKCKLQRTLSRIY